MTDREAMQMALDALNLPSMKTMQMLQQRDEAITALRAQLEQPEQEPVHGDIRALRYRIFELEGEVLGYKRMLDVAEAPHRRKPLTDEEIDQLLPEIVSGGSFTVITYGRAVARAIEAKIKENT